MPTLTPDFDFDVKVLSSVLFSILVPTLPRGNVPPDAPASLPHMNI